MSSNLEHELTTPPMSNARLIFDMIVFIVFFFD
ncbi:hypothetical protein M472_15560 [Sphingobacterium paucimobilis HER1398]|uniref:Uncharacterized protein n=1 Tax=Sphingobacterium paucimobilis HER1398 TaxID=1346330 RepID=U2HXB1_9SPHI|nr:hypothetical protein M472_15560 [Sphingobacterium paucimobilis HER1398]